MKRGMTIEYLMCRSDLNFEVGFRVNNRQQLSGFYKGIEPGLFIQQQQHNYSYVIFIYLF